MVPPTPARILLIDDHPDLIEMHREILEQAGYAVAVRLSRTTDDVITENPDLVIVDAPYGHLGEILDFLQMLRLCRAIQHLPVIVTTTDARRTMAPSLRARRIHLLLKPYDTDQLLASVAEMLGTGRPTPPHTT